MPVLAMLNPLPLIRPILLPPIHIATFLLTSTGYVLKIFTGLLPPESLVQFLTTALFLGLSLGTIIALVHYFLLRTFNLSPSQRLRLKQQAAQGYNAYRSGRIGKRTYDRYGRYGREWEDENLGGYTFFGGRMEKILEEEEEEGW